jgi:ABC-type amino acid transport substrate-binding protein
MPLVRTRSKSLAALVACAVIAACGDDRASDGAPAAGDSGNVPPEAPVPTVNAADTAADIAADTPADDPAHGVTPGERLPLSFGRIWQPWFGDFDAMVERRIVRAVVPYGGYQFFYEDGQPRGATYELLQRLEQHLNAELKRGNLKVYVVVVPLGRDELIPALLEGHADLIAGDLTITGERASRLAFTRPLLTDINEIVVTGPAAAPVDAMDDLAGRDIVVRA